MTYDFIRRNRLRAYKFKPVARMRALRGDYPILIIFSETKCGISMSVTRIPDEG